MAALNFVNNRSAAIVLGWLGSQSWIDLKSLPFITVQEIGSQETGDKHFLINFSITEHLGQCCPFGGVLIGISLAVPYLVPVSMLPDVVEAPRKTG